MLSGHGHAPRPRLLRGDARPRPEPQRRDSPWVEFDLARRRLASRSPTVTPAIEPSASAGGTIAFEVEDLPALIADLKAKGVAFAAEGIESPVCRMAIIKDPDGNRRSSSAQTEERSRRAGLGSRAQSAPSTMNSVEFGKFLPDRDDRLIFAGCRRKSSPPRRLEIRGRPAGRSRDRLRAPRTAPPRTRKRPPYWSMIAAVRER